MGKLKRYQEQLQDIVEKGINAAEEQQKKLAAKPFDYAEKLESEAREYSVKTLRKRYNGYSDSLFDQLRSLNSRFGNFAAELVAKLEKEAAEGADAVSEAAEDVSEAAQDAKKSVEAKKPAARKSTARKSTSTAKKSTASA
jgi:DNA repair ATPase RecN